MNAPLPHVDTMTDRIARHRGAFDSLPAVLRRAIEGPGGLLSDGNVISDVQISSYIRAWNDTAHPAGLPCKPGDLQRFDVETMRKAAGPFAHVLERWARAFCLDSPAVFYVWRRAGRNDARVYYGATLATGSPERFILDHAARNLRQWGISATLATLAGLRKRGS